MGRWLAILTVVVAGCGGSGPGGPGGCDKARHIPLHPELARILREWRERCPATDEDLVFPVEGRMGTMYETLGLAALLPIAECHAPAHPWHALRHTFASHFMMAGGKILTLQKLLGHATLATTMIYAHLSPDHLAGEVALMNFALPAPAGTVDLSEERRQRQQATVA